MEKLFSAIDDVVNCVIDSNEYKKCLALKKQMNNNEELSSLIDEIKKLQKKYIRSNYDFNIQEKLDSLEKKLNDIPIYSVYLNNLEKVNEMIEIIKENLNDYFQKLLNEKISD